MFYFKYLRHLFVKYAGIAQVQCNISQIAAVSLWLSQLLQSSHNAPIYVEGHFY